MDNLLEWMLDNTRTDNVISENNDINSIDTGGGAAASLQQRIDAIRGGSWDQAEYGITAEAQIARLIATQGNPEALAIEDGILRQRAIRRAGLDTTNGRIAVMVAGAPPWHKLGVNVASAVTSADARNLAGLNWTVSKRPLAYQHPTGGDAYRAQDDVYAVVRDDTGAFLGHVGSRYSPIQNDEGWDFLDHVLAQYGAKYSTAGAIHGGKKVWMLADMPGSSFSVGRGDEVKAYAIFSNPHDGSGKAFCYPTSERVVCANTLRVATAKDSGKGIGIRHTGSIKAKIASAQAALGLAVTGFAEFAENAATLVRKRVSDPLPYVNAVLDSVLDVSAEDVAKGAEAIAREAKVSPEDFAYCVQTGEKQIKRRGEILADILDRFESERCRVNGVSGTAWALLNSVTEHADYANGQRKVGTAEQRSSRKFESVLSGDADEMKQVAYVQALAMSV